MSHRLLLAGLLMIVASACDSPPTSTRDPLTELVPLSVGAEWTYTHADSGQDRLAVFDSVNTMRVLRDTLALGIRWYLVERNDMIPSATTMWFANTAGGLRRLAAVGSGLVWDAYQHPPVLGRVFITANGQTMRAFVLDTTIAVPAGTFKCVGYEWVASEQNGTLSAYRKQYLCPGVGLAKDVRDRVGLANGQVVGWRIKVLTSFRP